MALKRYVIEREIPNIGGSSEQGPVRRGGNGERCAGEARSTRAVGAQLRDRRQDVLRLSRRGPGRDPRTCPDLRLPRHGHHRGEGDPRSHDGALAADAHRDADLRPAARRRCAPRDPHGRVDEEAAASLIAIGAPIIPRQIERVSALDAGGQLGAIEVLVALNATAAGPVLIEDLDRTLDLLRGAEQVVAYFQRWRPRQDTWSGVDGASWDLDWDT